MTNHKTAAEVREAMPHPPPRPHASAHHGAASPRSPHRYARRCPTLLPAACKCSPRRRVAPLSPQVREAMLAASGKLVLLDKLLPKLRSEGRRVLIFSQVC